MIAPPPLRTGDCVALLAASIPMEPANLPLVARDSVLLSA